ncbi:MAG: flagellar biosynthesis anti-sigma factor FlgM [Clostridiales bacterium]|nr:flagellar biosynthesis anti-sigma factor FlgM [Clostridiales bacterium]
MKINPITSPPTLSAYRAQGIISQVQDPASSADQISLSEEVAAYSTTINKLKEHMDIRTPKEAAHIETIAKQIENGAYHVDSKKVAAKIVDDYLI